jgi:hypothetical protein
LADEAIWMFGMGCVEHDLALPADLIGPSVPTCLRHPPRCRLVSLDRSEMSDDEEFTCV